MVDRHLLGRKLSEMEAHLDQVSEHSGISIKTYKWDWITKRAVCQQAV